MLGTLYTISAPSGAGKTSLVKALVTTETGLLVSVSHTTRARRPGEVDGENYHFISQDNFERMVERSEFVEYATVFDNSYGTSKVWVTSQLEQGYDVILEIDWQGAQQIHAWAGTQQQLKSVGIFILPPSLAALKARLTTRGQDDESVITSRMAQAVSEISHYADADFLVINDQFEEALKELSVIFQGQRLKTSRQAEVYQALLLELLGAD